MPQPGEHRARSILPSPSPAHDEAALAALIRENDEPIQDLHPSCADALLGRIGDARIVLLGEATHGTSEFYRMRARITMELIRRRHFDFVAVEADWPDAARIDAYVFGDEMRPGPRFTPFSRFPSWMWRNEEVAAFASWLREFNVARPRNDRCGFHGLDLYSMFTSIAAVLHYLDGVDAVAGREARERYALFTRWRKDPALYGRDVLAGRTPSFEDAVVPVLKELLERRLDYVQKDGERFFDAVQNARVVANAERYYRAMYQGSVRSWNLRDTHMFETLQALLAYYGPDARGIVWEHNSHVGDSLATEMSERGEINVGRLCRAKFGDAAYLVGFGTDHGRVAAASGWDEPVEFLEVRPSHADSYERLFHEAGTPASFLHLRAPRHASLRDELTPSRLERAIGVVYRPETELESHYFYASLPEQFDEMVWFDRTSAVTPLGATETQTGELPDTWPFGL